MFNSQNLTKIIYIKNFANNCECVDLYKIKPPLSLIGGKTPGTVNNKK